VDEKIREAMQEAKDSGEFDGKDGVDGKDGSDATVTAESIENALGYVPANASNSEVFIVRVENEVPDKTLAEIADAVEQKKIVNLLYERCAYALISFVNNTTSGQAYFARIIELGTGKIACREITINYFEGRGGITKKDSVVEGTVDYALDEGSKHAIANMIVTAKFGEVNEKIELIRSQSNASIVSDRIVKTEVVYSENLVFESEQAVSNTVCPLEAGAEYRLLIKGVNAEDTIIVDQVLTAAPYELDDTEVGVMLNHKAIGVVSLYDEFASAYGVSTMVTIGDNDAGITEGELLVSVSKTTKVIDSIETRLDNIVNEVIAALPTAEGVSF
jgi:hypothetical protein